LLVNVRIVRDASALVIVWAHGGRGQLSVGIDRPSQVGSRRLTRSDHGLSCILQGVAVKVIFND
jgi:hypothetical protein